MKRIFWITDNQKQIQTMYLLVQCKKIIPLGNFKKRYLTKENFSLYGVIDEKLYEFSIDDFEPSEYPLFINQTYKMSCIAALYHIHKKIFLISNSFCIKIIAKTIFL